MAITDIISEEIETRAPNMEVAQGSPDDFMTEDEMDPMQDPELQEILRQLGPDQSEVLMQLIKEFKAMVAQGFQGEFEDFVKMKMASAQGGSEEDFMSEEEMIIPDEELQSMVPMGQQVAQGGRIGYQNAGPVGGIMDVAVEEQVERGPTTQQLIMKWLNDRGLPITPENIQRAIMELSREGQGPAMPRGEMDMAPMEQPRPPTGEGYVPEELIGQTGAEVVEMGPRGEEDVFSDEEMRAMKQKYIEQGGTLDKASWGLEEDEVDDTGIMQIDDSITYTDDEEPYTRDMFKESSNTLLKGMYGMPNSREYLQDQMMNKINRYRRHNPDATNEEIHEILKGEKYSISDLLRQQSAKGVPFTLAQGGRIGYQYGNQVTPDAPGVRSQVSPERQYQIEGSQELDNAYQKIMQKFMERFPGIDSTEMSIEDMIAMLQGEGVFETEGAGIMDIGAGMDMITPESVRGSMPGVTRGMGEPNYGEHQFDHPVDEMRYGNAYGGRPGYQYGNQVTADAPGVRSQVSPESMERQYQIEGNQRFEDMYDRIMQEFAEKFPSIDSSEMSFEDMVAMLQASGVMNTEGADLLDMREGMKMITPQSVRGSLPGFTRGMGEPNYEEHQFDHPVDEMRYGNAYGGRPGYQYGNQVTADAPGVRSQVSPSRKTQIEGNQIAEDALNKIIIDFYRKFPEASEEDIQQMIRNYVAEEQFEGVMGTEGAGILDIHEGAKMITPESVDRSAQAISRHHWQEGGRARYGLGSFVKGIFKGAKKGVKGLVKSVKKFAKSDLGKMALMYMATAGMANIGAGGSWASPFTKGAGTGWLRPGTVMSNLGTSWGNIGKAFKGAPEIATDWRKNIKIPGVTTSYDKPASLGSKLLGSFKDNPLPWIAGTSLASGLYTAKNPGEDNLDELMRNYKGEVGDWDKMIADIRAGKGPTTPFSTSNITYPYPDYKNLAAEGGRIGRAEGGLMDLGGLEKDYRAEGGFVPIGKKEKADDVPARLSVNEFVFTADAVRNAGGGDVDKGSEVMENVMTNLEQGGSISEESQGLEGARDMFEVSERLSEVV